jgi:hypothetical protein
MITLREAASDLLKAVVAAIESGDWKVDGACDPTVYIVRLKNILAKPEPQWIGLTDEEMNDLWVEYHGDSCIADGRIPEYEKAIEVKLKEKNSG